MKTQVANFYQLWKEARTRLTNQLGGITGSDLSKRLGDSPNSVGFLLRHIADVELLFAKNVFGSTTVKVIAKTVISAKDTGEWTDLEDLITYLELAEDELESIILEQPDEAWKDVIETKEFGVKTKSEALGRIVSHTAYHAGQIGMIMKYGKA